MITLRSFTPADFPRLIAWVTDEALLTQFAGPIFQYPLTEEQLYVYLAEPQRRAFSVLHRQRAIGHAEIMLSKDGVAKLCRILIGNPEDRGKGWGEQIVRVLVELCRKKYDVKAIELNVYDWNIEAIRCYEKVGFTRSLANSLPAKVGDETWMVINMRLNR